ncbi:hypothetical protein FACS1894130_10350 [Spirochaetia bacterium]|nr:hypothetical protein FACS1894130_10350 [Spirochaetia bacterium]
MGDNVSVIIAVLIDIVLLYFLTKDAKKYGIYLSMPIKVMFFLTFTVPFIILWYFIKRNKIKKSINPKEE